MEIYDERGSDNLKLFKDIDDGDVFQLADKFYMKIPETICYYNYNAISLKDGSPECIDHYIKVELLNAELHIYDLKG